MMTQTEFRNSVVVLPPQPIEESGKIYAYKDYIFVPFTDDSNGFDTYGGGRYLNMSKTYSMRLN